MVGLEIKTKYGNTLTIKEVIKVNGYERFICECSVCSLDEELFPYGSIKGYKSHINKGHVPCGCSKTYRWSEQQSTVRIERLCNELRLVFIGFTEQYKGHKTKLTIYSPELEETFYEININNLFSRKTGNGKISDEKIIENFKKHIKLSNKNFKRFGSCWEYTCEVCSFDEYVINGLCSGVFKSKTKSLNKGCASCRCSDVYKWTQEQREYQLIKRCKELGYTFNEWCGEYKNGSSKFIVVCDKNHETEKSIDAFLNAKTGCRECKYSTGYNGFYQNRLQDKDYLYIMKFKNDFIKIGRTFNIESRMEGTTGIIKSSGYSSENISILAIFYGTHEKIYDTEQKLLHKLRQIGLSYPLNWTNEAFKVDALSIAESEINNYISIGYISLCNKEENN